MVDFNFSSDTTTTGLFVEGDDINFSDIELEESDSSTSESSMSGELISGSSSDDIIVSLDDNDTIEGQEGDDVLSSVEGNNYLKGNLGNDTLTGGGLGFEDGEIFITADAEEIDTLSGGENSDHFILGGRSHPILDEDSETIVHYDEEGNDDYAVITDFEPVEDVILLGGSEDDYRLVYSGTSSDLYVDDELIAIIQGDAQLSLSESYFQYQE
ncbi:MAG: hypothetical protein AAF383_21935 [Cyanobacteria bacterium P01_A01_bin.83]